MQILGILKTDSFFFETLVIGINDELTFSLLRGGSGYLAGAGAGNLESHLYAAGRGFFRAGVSQAEKERRLSEKSGGHAAAQQLYFSTAYLGCQPCFVFA